MCLAGLCMGAQGAIGTTYNFMGDVFVEIAARVAASDLPEAQRLQRMANVVIEALIECGVMPSSKALLEMMGVPVGGSRRPFRALDGADRARLATAIRPVLDWRERRRAAAA
jgi:N-acetylneuraminate lyase